MVGGGGAMVPSTEHNLSPHQLLHPLHFRGVLIVNLAFLLVHVLLASPPQTRHLQVTPHAQPVQPSEMPLPHQRDLHVHPRLNRPQRETTRAVGVVRLHRRGVIALHA